MFIVFTFFLLITVALSQGAEYDVSREQLLDHDNVVAAAYAQYLDLLKSEVTTEKLDKVIRSSSGYASAKPFPHMSAMDIFPLEVLQAANLEIPDHPPPSNREGCVPGSCVCFTDELQNSKSGFRKESKFGPATKAILHFIQSNAFIEFLEKVTGIEGLIPDRSYHGSGIHQVLPGGFLNIHADFNLDVKNNLHRRVNLFIYMNPDWRDEYGGHLELWSRDLQRCEARISPDLGKLVVFSSTDFSYHGHQAPLSCPQNRSRRSLALYYYTKTRPDHECLDNDCQGTYHSTLFQTTECPDCSDTSMCYASTA